MLDGVGVLLVLIYFFSESHFNFASVFISICLSYNLYETYVVTNTLGRVISIKAALIDKHI